MLNSQHAYPRRNLHICLYGKHLLAYWLKRFTLPITRLRFGFVMVFDKPCCYNRSSFSRFRFIRAVRFQLTIHHCGQSLNSLHLVHSLPFRSPTKCGCLIKSATPFPFLPLKSKTHAKTSSANLTQFLPTALRTICQLYPPT